MKNESEYKNIIGAIVLDLDFTLIGFRGGFSKLLDDLAFVNINPAILSSALDYANDTGFTIDLFIKAIERFQNETINQKAKNKIKEKFNDWLKGSLHIFDDAKDFLDICKDKIPIFILTFGCLEYQQKKIKMLGLEKFPVYYSSEPHSKVKKLDAILKDYKYVAYVDDNINEINEIAKYNTTKRIFLFWLNRNNKLKEHIKKMSDYILISSLLDLNKYIFIKDSV